MHKNDFLSFERTGNKDWFVAKKKIQKQKKSKKINNTHLLIMRD